MQQYKMAAKIMLYYKIFTESSHNTIDTMRIIFGAPECRKNKILIAALKDKQLAKEEPYYFWRIKTLDDVYAYTMFVLNINMDNFGLNFKSLQYKLDENKGICDDGDTSAIRYERIDNGKVYKMKAGKFFRKLLAESCIAGVCEQVAAYCAEEFARRWEVYATNNCESKYNLVVDNDFRRIYSSNYCVGNFGSCMTDKEYHTYYTNSVDAHAASLQDDEGFIYARCIIYDEVRDDVTGEVYRLAERQYASDGDERLKRLLIDKLIAGKYIDGYKAVGAGCGDSQNFIPVGNISFHKDRLSIECIIDDDNDTVSYQDSFKSYDAEGCRAYNYGCGSYDLAVTDGGIDMHANECWSDFNGCWIDDNDAVYIEERNDYFFSSQTVYAYIYNNSRGDWFEDYQLEDDCININGNWYYVAGDADDAESYGVYKCPECGEYYTLRDDDYSYSDMLDENYCTFECRKDAEEYELEYHSDDFEEWVMTDDGAMRKKYCFEVWSWNDDEGQWGIIYKCDKYYTIEMFGFLVDKYYAESFYEEVLLPLLAA